MKSKNLPKRKNVNHSPSDEVRRHAVKLKQKRAKKPSIYDEMSEDEYDDVYSMDYDREDEDEYDYNYDKEDNEDYY